jgi:hypothetical protein
VFLKKLNIQKLGNSCISIFSKEHEASNTAKTYFSEVKFSFHRFLERNLKSDAILIFFLNHFPEKMSKKVNLQKRHYLKTCICIFTIFFIIIKASKLKKEEVLFTGFQNGCDFKNGWKTGFSAITQ